MKGNPKIVEELNSLLEEELTAINQYMVHAEMAENWGYGKLHDVSRKRAFVEMKHAEKIIERILFLEGNPIVSKLRDIRIGDKVPKQLENDLSLENDAVGHYNAVINLCAEQGDAGTRLLLQEIVKQEEEHVDEIETHLDQIEQLGLPQFLMVQAQD